MPDETSPSAPTTAAGTPRPQSALTRKLLDPAGQEELLAVAAQAEKLWPLDDGRRLVEAVLRECGYGLPPAPKGCPLWQWVQLFWRSGWLTMHDWMAVPVIGNLFVIAGDDGPESVGVVLKEPVLERNAFSKLCGDRAERQVLLADVEGYLVPPDGCRGCAQRGALLRRE